MLVQNSEFCDGENTVQQLSRPKSTRKFRWFRCCVPSGQRKRKELWLAIRFKITTGYTRVFLPRILVYIRYVWALNSYIRPFRSRIFAFLRATHLRKFKRGDMPNKCPNIRVLQGPKGGAVASWLVRSSPDRAVRVRALAGDIVLCSWARHFTLTVPLSTQVYKWVPG